LKIFGGGALAVAAATFVHAQAGVDLILTNGKIITVDERFTIAQRWRFAATASCGRSNQEITRWPAQHAAGSDLAAKPSSPA